MLLQVVADTGDVRGDPRYRWTGAHGRPSAVPSSASSGWLCRHEYRPHDAEGFLSAGVLFFETLSCRPLRTNCWMVGTESPLPVRGLLVDRVDYSLRVLRYLVLCPIPAPLVTPLAPTPRSGVSRLLGARPISRYRPLDVVGRTASSPDVRCALA